MNSTTLYFDPYNGPTSGFTSNDADRDRVKDPIVVRELIQNGLDAAQNHGVRVSFRLADIPLKEIPHITKYREVFDLAREYLEADEPTTGRHAIERIKKALQTDKISCLFCIDDGKGINPEALRGLYSRGRSTKGSGGGNRGSVGNGHLTAFAPSDLRYVLYGGLCEDKMETFGGHAILATHRVRDQGRAEDRSNNGFIREDREQLALFADERAGDKIPKVMSQYMHFKEDMLSDGHNDLIDRVRSGSVVMIVGYDPISYASDARLFLGSAAQHFTVAAYDGSLTVDFSHDRQAPESLDSTSLWHWVGLIRGRRDQRRTQRTFQTLEIGELLSTDGLGEGCKVWFRRSIDPGETDRSRVAVFRDGMWIQDNPIGMEPRNFPDVRSFDAVVDLDSNYEFGGLVREAEGVSHLEINPKEINDTDRRNRLNDFMKELRILLINAATPVGDIEDYEPPELRLFSEEKTIMKLIPPPRTKEIKDKEDLPVEPPKPDPNPPPTPPKPGPNPLEPKPGPMPRPRPSLRPGRTTGLSVSCRPKDSRGQFLVSWRTEGETLPSGAAGLRLFVPSGTDRASANHVPARYLTMDSAIGVGQSGAPAVRSGEFEAVIMESSGVALISIDTALATDLNRDQELGLVRAELVHRKLVIVDDTSSHE